MEEITIYERYAEKEEKAITAARKIFAAKRPPPILPRIKSNVWKFIAGFTIMVIAGMIVSGVHTIPLFQKSVEAEEIFGISTRTLVGNAAFIMIEVGMIMLAISRIIHYTSMQKETWEQNNKQVSKFIQITLGLIFSVALLGNIYSTVKLGIDSNESESAAPVSMPMAGITTINNPQNATVEVEKEGIPLDKIVSLILFTLMGSAAPVVTVLSGEVIGKVLVSEGAKKDILMKRYNEDMEAWNQEFIADYRSHKGRGVWKIEVDNPTESTLLEIPEKAGEELKAIYIDKDRRQCPKCRKIMTKQSWTRHPCRVKF